jgi:tetratricopeptide (TPR) repeat protein
MRSARTFQDDGDFDEAALRLTKAIVEFERIDDSRRAGLARTRLALIAIERGDLDAAIRMLDDARASFDADTDPLIVRESWLYACAAHALAGRFAEAEAALAAGRLVPEAWSSARHSRHYAASFEALIIACRARAALPIDRAGLEHAKNAIIAAETPGADGCSAVNCFYVLRACMRLIRRVLPEDARPIGTVVVANDGTWFQLVDGRSVELAHRPVLARVLAALAAAAAAPRGSGAVEDAASSGSVAVGDAASSGIASVAELLRAGWSVDSAVGSSGELRVYTSISRLRKLGLRDAIVQVPGGYRLDAEVVAQNVRSVS